MEELVRQNGPAYPFDLRNFHAGMQFLSADPQTQRAIVMHMLAWLDQHPLNAYPRSPQEQTTWQVGWQMRETFLAMLKHKLPFTEQDVIALLNWSAGRPGDLHYTYLRHHPQMIKVVGELLKTNSVSDELFQAIERLIQSIETGRMSIESRRWVLRLKELRGDTEARLPLESGDAWAEAALRELQTLEAGKQTAWAELLLHCLRSTGSAPSSKWLKGVDKYLEIIGRTAFFHALSRWFPLVEKPRPASAHRYGHIHSLLAVNIDILKGLAWICSKAEDPEIARALTSLAISTYKKLPGSGPRAAKVGNACFWALGNMNGTEGIAQLSILKIKVKTNTARKLIAQGLEIAAKRMGITAEEIEEMSVPTYGLEEVGLRRAAWDDVISEVRVNGSEVEQVWICKDGKQLSAAPKVLRRAG